MQFKNKKLKISSGTFIRMFETKPQRKKIMKKLLYEYFINSQKQEKNYYYWVCCKLPAKKQRRGIMIKLEYQDIQEHIIFQKFS